MNIVGYFFRTSLFYKLSIVKICFSITSELKKVVLPWNKAWISLMNNRLWVYTYFQTENENIEHLTPEQKPTSQPNSPVVKLNITV